jgi:hypothetical protein
MKRSRTSKSLRGWLPAAAAFVVAFAMLLQPICAPACAATHCAARMDSGTAMHCNGAEDQPEASLAAARHACSSTETLPAVLGAEIRQPSPRYADDSLTLRFTADAFRADDESASSLVPPPTTFSLPRKSSSSLSAILRV